MNLPPICEGPRFRAHIDGYWEFLSHCMWTPFARLATEQREDCQALQYFSWAKRELDSFMAMAHESSTKKMEEHKAQNVRDKQIMDAWLNFAWK